MVGLTKRLGISLLGLLVFGSHSYGVITVECKPMKAQVPVPGPANDIVLPEPTFITGTAIVTVECFILSDAFVESKGLQVGFDCNGLELLPGGTGTVSKPVVPCAATADCAELGSGSVCLGGTPRICSTIFSSAAGSTLSDPDVPRIDGAGLTPANETLCFLGVTPPPGGAAMTLDADTRRYLGTFIVKASECSGGEFVVEPDGIGTPPTAGDRTRMRDNLPTPLLYQLTGVRNILTVDVGSCCLDGACLGDKNEICCFNMNGAFDTDRSCVTGGCPCLTVADCNDNNACTTDACVSGFCQQTNNTISCSDGNFCTANDVCTNGACIGGANPCISPLFCSEALDSCVQCLQASHCNDNIFCTTDTCTATGTCSNVNSTIPCDDGEFCTAGDVCSGGVCQRGTGPTCTTAARPFCDENGNACRTCIVDVDCNDNNPCTTDDCTVTFTCVRALNTGPCQDGQFCTTGDTCAGGACVPGTGTPCVAGETCDESIDLCVECMTAGDCNDNNVCTNDSCVSGQCQYLNNTGLCDDLLFCTAVDTCSNGQCVPGGDACPGEFCDEANNRCNECTISDDCSNGDFCDGPETCQNGSCMEGVNPCALGLICDEAGNRCVQCLAAADCLDALFCNGEETCTNNNCVAGTNPCTGGEVCNEGANRCDPAPDCVVDGDCADANVCTTNLCVGGACTSSNNTAACNDNIFCTATDVCSGGVCVGTGIACPGRQCDEANDRCVDCFTPGECNDNNLCTNDTCTAQGTCSRVNNAVSCNDNLFCTAVDRCSAGACLGSGAACVAGQICQETQDRCVQCENNTQCNDNNVCTSDSCNVTSGLCVFAINTAPCSDGFFCTAVDVCTNGACVGSGAACVAGQICQETQDRCVQCENNSHCNDSNVCTNDSCNVTSGQCVFANNTVPCNDGLFCTAVDRCSAGACLGTGAVCPAADRCDEATDGCIQCDVAGQCEDGNPGTENRCTSGRCVFPPLPPGAACGDASDTACDNPDTADGNGNCLANREVDGTPCPNSLFCNGAETCQGGLCVDRPDPCRSQSHCNENADKCFACILDSECADVDPCTEDRCLANVCSNQPIPGCVASAGDRQSISKKGSLLVYSKVELQWQLQQMRGGGFSWVLTQDTVLSLTNDFQQDVSVQFYFINGDRPLDAVYAGAGANRVLIERAHPGWNWVDCQVRLTSDQPTYWSAASGLPMGCQPYDILDPTGVGGPGRPNPDAENRGTRVLRGYVMAWAVNRQGEEIRWNHLVGGAVLINYADATAAEYNAYSFHAVAAQHGLQTGTPGVLNLDGVEYDQAFDKLNWDFYGADTTAFTGHNLLRVVFADTDLTLHLVSADLRQDSDGPGTTKAKFDVWNQNEIRFSGTEKCVTCWDQTLISNYPLPNNLLRANLQTDKGRARIDGLGSLQCPFSVDAALLGISIKELSWLDTRRGGVNGVHPQVFARSAISLVGQGEQDAVIQFDIISGPSDLVTVPQVIGGIDLTAGVKGPR